MSVFEDFPLLTTFVLIVSIFVIYRVVAIQFGDSRGKKARECQNCGTSLPWNASYCKRCGTKLPG
jgi:hypothetical protein